MLEPLLPHFERELEALRTLGAAFARRYPKVARRLPEPETGADPHGERMVEAFALLAARIHRQLDDGFPEATEALLQVLFPQDLRPVPAATILQLAPAARHRARWPIIVPRRTPVLAPATQGVRCGFRTTREVELWPVAVARADLARVDQAGAAAVLTLDLESPPDLPFRELGADGFTFFLDGEPPLMHLLHELLLFRTAEVQVAGGAGLPGCGLPGAIRPVGLEPGEACLDGDPAALPGTRLWSDYFACPDAFLFVRLAGLGGGPLDRLGSRLQVRFRFSRFGSEERHQRLLRTLGAGQFRLGCVPAVNLFRRAAVPIQVTHRQPAYPVVPEGLGPEVCEVHGIDSVVRTVRGAGPDATEPVPPLFALRPGPGAGGHGLRWHAARGTPDGTGAAPLELALVDLDFRPLRPGVETLSVQLTCTNRDLPGQIPFGGGRAVQEEFTLPGRDDVPRARALRKPSPAHRPPDKRGHLHRLVARLALAQAAPETWDLEALRAALALQLPATPAAAEQIRGIHRYQARPCSVWLPGRATAVPVRGTEVALTLDESCFVGSNLYLFATLLERFLGQQCGPNAFVRVRLSTRHQQGETVRWPPRSGAAPLT
jgi:type VI secretion system protein ImpG